MTKQDLQQCEALLTWAKALDTEAEAVQARINATQPSARVEVMEKRKGGRGRRAAVRF